MSEKHIVRHSWEDLRNLRAKSKMDWARFHAMTDEEVDAAARSDPDAQPTDAEFWKDAEIVQFVPKKVPISLRVDWEVLDFFKRQGPRYQSRMNAVLRSYMIHTMRQKATP